MVDYEIAEKFLQKCEIRYDDCLISKEAIIREYFRFFSNTLESGERAVSFSFHTGSPCFEYAAVAAAALYCLAFSTKSVDDIIADLHEGDMVIYKKQRYRWCGTEKIDDKEHIVLRQDETKKGGELFTKIPFEKKKNLIKPYYGDATVTDGRGINQCTSNRDDFLSFLYDLPPESIPGVLKTSIVVVATRKEFSNIVNKLQIYYDGGKSVSLTDIVPAAYYTGGGNVIPYAGNTTKAEAVLKVVDKLSVARHLILSREFHNKSIGLLVTDSGFPKNDRSELEELMRRKSLKFIHVLTPYKMETAEELTDACEDASVFVCTKESLSKFASEKIKEPNSLTRELNRQIQNSVKGCCVPQYIPGWSWDEYSELKSKLIALKRSDGFDGDTENFAGYANGMLNLLSSAPFSMKKLEHDVSDGLISDVRVRNPGESMAELKNFVPEDPTITDLWREIVNGIEKKFDEFYEETPKGNLLLKRLCETDETDAIAVIVPRAYYSEIILRMCNSYGIKGVTCSTASCFDINKNYDLIIAVSDDPGNYFDILRCAASEKREVLLYDFERKWFERRCGKIAKAERKLNARAKIIEWTQPAEKTPNEREENPVDEEIMREFDDFDRYIAELNMRDFQKYAVTSEQAGGNTQFSEVFRFGTFTTGEQILFTKNYKAVVFNEEDARVIEQSVENLNPGDLLIFTKNDNLTKNIVDSVYEKLVEAGKLNDEVIEAFEKSTYWKEALRDYKASENASYNEIAGELGCEPVTVRQWLAEESHTVGPRKAESVQRIAELTRDTRLLGSENEVFEAIRLVRRERGKILKLIANAVTLKLSGGELKNDEILSVVYDNVDELSVMLELEDIQGVDTPYCVPVNLVNRPLTE